MDSTILIIEDNVGILENTGELLELAGYKTIRSQCGKEGVELAKNHKPDIILCDALSPNFNGYDILHEVENIPNINKTPFIFISDKGEKPNFRKGEDYWSDDYLMKPFNGADLLRAVNSRLEKSRMLKKLNDSDAIIDNDGSKPFMTLKDIKALSKNVIVKNKRKKDFLFIKGDPANFIYFVVSGKIKTFKTNDYGKDFITEILKEGNFLGYAALLENSDHKESAMIIENAEIATIPRQDFFELLNSNSAVAMQFIKCMSNRLSSSQEKLLNLAYDSARKRVAEALLFIYRKYQDEGSSELSFVLNRDNISELAGLAPESVSRNLTHFREEGLIETVHGIIKIVNVKKLETIKG